MFLYQEIKDGTRSVFEIKHLDDRGAEVSTRRVDYALFEIEHEGLAYLILYDPDMKAVGDAFAFLNHDLRDSPISSRRKAAHDLRSIFCFLTLNNTEISEIDESTLIEMRAFFKGIGPAGRGDSPVLPRSNRTINGYFSTLRNFCKKRRIECPALFRHRSQTRTASRKDAHPKSEPYSANLIDAQAEGKIPRYISAPQFSQLLELARRDEDGQAEVMMRLMFMYGLRLGETLGLTTEDVIEKRCDGGPVPTLVIRNRASDRPFQFAKNLPHVSDQRQYGSRDYRDATWEVAITWDTYGLLSKVASAIHRQAACNHPGNYAKAQADIVSQEEPPDENHYLFLNRYGKPLSDQTWNNRLKRLFSEAEIPIDHVTRKNNLSHRFRHGFAMWHAHSSPNPVDELQLSKMMRHRGTSSVAAYFNLTDRERHQLVEKLQEELFSAIPGLSEWPPARVDAP